MNAIVAVGKNWEIGRDGKLLAHIPEDMKFFRETTSGKVVVMGRKTFESLPQKPLKNRVNIVLTRNRAFEATGVIVVGGLDELLSVLRKYKQEDIFIIGGGQVYADLLPYCDKIYVTRIEKEFVADTFFPNLDNMREWGQEKGELHEHDGLPFRFCIYTRK